MNLSAIRDCFLCCGVTFLSSSVAQEAQYNSVSIWLQQLVTNSASAWIQQLATMSLAPVTITYYMVNYNSVQGYLFFSETCLSMAHKIGVFNKHI